MQSLQSYQSFKDYNPISLEPRHLTRSELETISYDSLFSRIKNIVFNARRKVVDPGNSVSISLALFRILNDGLTALESRNIDMMKAYYLNTYVPLILSPMNFTMDIGIEDFSHAIDSDWSNNMRDQLATADAKITELKYNEADSTFMPTAPMSGLGSTSDSDKSTMRLVQWTLFGAALYLGYKFYFKSKAKR